MEKEPDINKVVRQHADMDDFFTGGFAPAGEKNKQKKNEASQSANDIKIELEKINDEVHRCRKCQLGSLRTNAVPGE